jgi:hypothetical protein
MAKHISEAELYATEAYKKSGLIYPHPKQLLTMFKDTISACMGSFKTTGDIKVTVDKESGVGLVDGKDLKAYARGILRLNFVGSSDTIIPTVGLIWAYDISSPFIKVFSGVNAVACTNLCIFRANDIRSRFLKGVRVRDEKEREREWNIQCSSLLSAVGYMLEDLMEDLVGAYNETLDKISALKSKVIPKHKHYDLVGRIYIEDVIKGVLDYSTFNEAMRLIFNMSYMHENQILYTVTGEEELTLWRLYGALTQRITDGGVELDAIPDKTLIISETIDKYLDYEC